MILGGHCLWTNNGIGQIILNGKLQDTLHLWVKTLKHMVSWDFSHQSIDFESCGFHGASGSLSSQAMQPTLGSPDPGPRVVVPSLKNCFTNHGNVWEHMGTYGNIWENGESPMEFHYFQTSLPGFARLTIEWYLEWTLHTWNQAFAMSWTPAWDAENG